MFTEVEHDKKLEGFHKLYVCIWWISFVACIGFMFVSLHLLEWNSYGFELVD